VCAKWPGVLGGHRTIDKLGNQPQYTKRETGENVPTTGASLLSLTGKVLAECLGKRYHEIIESKLNDTQCGFRPGRNTTDQIFEKFWCYAKDVCTCFVDHEKAYDHSAFHVKSFVEYYWSTVLTAARYCLSSSLSSCSEIFMRVNGVKLQPFTVGVRRLCAVPGRFAANMKTIGLCGSDLCERGKVETAHHILHDCTKFKPPCHINEMDNPALV